MPDVDKRPDNLVRALLGEAKSFQLKHLHHLGLGPTKFGSSHPDQQAGSNDI
jgi:hypothetical protein